MGYTYPRYGIPIPPFSKIKKKGKRKNSRFFLLKNFVGCEKDAYLNEKESTYPRYGIPIKSQGIRGLFNKIL